MEHFAASPAGCDHVRVVVVDDHRAFSETLAMAIDHQDDLYCVSLATTMEEAIAAVDEHAPDVVLADIRLPDGDGIEATKRIKAISPETQVIVLTAHADLELMTQAAAAGASAFISKERSLSEILQSIRSASGGSLSIDRSTLMAILNRVANARAGDQQHPMDRLTQREFEVLALMGQGLDPRTIAKRLNISIHTARGYVKNILAKLSVHSQLEAVVVAARRGLLPTNGGAH